MENLLLLSIGINTDIFETNIINIGILVALLFNVVGASLKSAMLQRKETIINSVQSAEQDVSEGEQRLVDAQTQLLQSELVIAKIVVDRESKILTLYGASRRRAVEEIRRQSESTELALDYKKKQVLREVKEEILALALSRVLEALKTQIPLDRHLALLDASINRVPNAFKTL
jgi:F-type H+-transporting ATPase subunit b